MAAEPMVADPIAIAWGADGALWVVEMGDYPTGPEVDDQRGGRVRVLYDENGDGKYDRSTLFLDDLPFPTGVLPWRRGVLVTCAPDIFYAEDTDGDGKADRREVLFTGFAQDNPQHRVNTPCYGLDGWVHCANGDSGGVIHSAKTGEATDIRGRDFRILPDDGVLEATTRMSQFTCCRDDWGNWFGGNSVAPFWHIIVADRYVRRNPYLVPPDLTADLMSPPLYAPVHPISGPAARFNEPHSARRFTSACGATVYRDKLLGPDFSRAFFVCDPVHNLVRAERMISHGMTFRSEPLLGGGQTEFFASSDPWCRPTMAKTGPDGALWVVDMYRPVIEHPDFIPSSMHDGLDFRAGADRGRLYRVYPTSRSPRQVQPLDHLDSSTLVKHLTSPNGPHRDLCQRLLVEQRSERAVPLLEKLVTSGSRPASRLQALATLSAIAPVEASILRHALCDRHPAVRRFALQVAEPRIADDPSLQRPVLALVDDSDGQVRLQLACSLGAWHDRRSAHALARLAMRDPDDPFLRTAVLSSATPFADLVLKDLLQHETIGLRHASLIRGLFLLLLEADQDAACATALQTFTASTDGKFADWQFEVLAGVLDELDRRGLSLQEVCERGGEGALAGVRSLNRLLDEARTVVLNRQASASRRVSAVKLLGSGPEKQNVDVDLLARLAAPQSPIAVQEAAIQALVRLRGRDGVQQLLAHWERHTPTTRERILDEVITRPEWIASLLALVETQQISAATIGPRHRFPLLTHRADAIRQQAQAVFQQAIQPRREEVVSSYRDALQREGDPQQGKRVFEKSCLGCHDPAAAMRIGPALQALHERSPAVLLADILAPNRRVDPKYLGYIATTTSGKVLTGVLDRETDHAITLVDAQGTRHTLRRTELEKLESTGQSLMPEGLEVEIATSQAMADLLAYLTRDTPDREP